MSGQTRTAGAVAARRMHEVGVACAVRRRDADLRLGRRGRRCRCRRPPVRAPDPAPHPADLHPIGRSDARPAPSEREPKPRRDRSSERRRYATMSSKESSSHMRASRRALRRANKGAWPTRSTPISSRRSTRTLGHRRFADRGPLTSVQGSQLVLGRLEHPFPTVAQSLTGTIDVEGEHRHRRAKRVALATSAAVGRSLQGSRDRARAPLAEDTLLEIQGVAGLGHVLRPAARRAGFRSSHFLGLHRATGKQLMCRAPMPEARPMAPRGRADYLARPRSTPMEPSLLTHYREMARYNRWMNEKLYALAAELSDEERKRPMGAFFGSLHGTFNHLLVTDRVWLARFGAGPLPAVKSFADDLISRLRRPAPRTRSQRRRPRRLCGGAAAGAARIELCVPHEQGRPAVARALAGALPRVQSPDAPPRPGHDALHAARSRSRRHRRAGAIARRSTLS